MDLSREIEFLQRALASPIGIAVRTDDYIRALARFYSARRAEGNPELWNLQLKRPPTGEVGEIWIMKITVEIEDVP